MISFKENCPFCGTTSVAFQIDHQRRIQAEDGFQWETLAVCGQCDRGVIARFNTPDRHPPDKCLRDSQYSRLLKGPVIIPSLPKSVAPNFTPDNVARFYMQGLDNMPRNWDAAGAMFRKTLDTGLKHKFPDFRGTLAQRIEKARESGELTASLADWANKIRLDGNQAAHDETPFTRKDAETLQVFTNLVLQYLFTLPGMLNEAKKV